MAGTALRIMDNNISETRVQNGHEPKPIMKKIGDSNIYRPRLALKIEESHEATFPWLGRAGSEQS